MTLLRSVLTTHLWGTQDALLRVRISRSRRVRRGDSAFHGILLGRATKQITQTLASPSDPRVAHCRFGARDSKENKRKKVGRAETRGSRSGIAQTTVAQTQLARFSSSTLSCAYWRCCRTCKTILHGA